ncbi:Uracil-DNA glycosylase [Nitrosomonas sp. Nm51]|uniref:uracil-DNA glycosylase family protein n=1 Tax=Nitrosomonas sp. Nm51 TaxID=133720 RepID=UPI0008BD8EAB|nr:uracil-DNA glycosylase family protein [Nitrosomonas sp. Nm51]SER81198.1 Uracil-DNA glycosylase [Nitrosomonas sp. Nm51]
MNSFFSLLAEIRGCTRCAEHLPHGVKPILQIHPQARVLIAGQAPGRKTHESGLPFDDASGDRLREWMGVTCETFYDSRKIAILPMGFCFPGTGKSGDLPPRPECAQTWHDQLAGHLRYLEVTLVVGRFAQAYYMNEGRLSLTETVRNWQSYGPKLIPLPHPSPRNNIWLSRNPWFEEDLLPMLKRRLSAVLES